MQCSPENIIELVTSRGALSKFSFIGMHLCGIVGEFSRVISSGFPYVGKQ